jgi:hypothetical protein
MVRFRVRLQIPELRLSDAPVVEVECAGKAKLVCVPVSAGAVVAYREPGEAVRSRDATIEFFELGETAVVHDCQRIAVTLDICGVSMPPLCQFRFFLVVGEEKVDPEGMELIGAEKLWTIGGRIAVNLCATLPGSQG